MSITHKSSGLFLFFMISSALCCAKTVKTAQGVFGYTDTSQLPWCSYIKHDPNRPMPVYVNPGPFGESANPPSDAIILFDGKNLSQWQPNEWKTANETVQAGQGNLTSRQPFSDCQLHLEFMIPEDQTGSIMDRGNSGVLLMGLYEVQIFDSHPSHHKQIYPDGQCAAVYGETPPLVNACRPPGQWQAYDILFTAPVFKNGKVVKPAILTMLHNGILVHFNTIIHGPMAHQKILPYQPHPDKLPLMLQGHKSPIRFRNIWIRPLDKTDHKE